MTMGFVGRQLNFVRRNLSPTETFRVSTIIFEANFVAIENSKNIFDDISCRTLLLVNKNRLYSA